MTRRIVLLLTFSLALALWARRRTKLEMFECSCGDVFRSRADFENRLCREEEDVQPVDPWLIRNVANGTTTSVMFRVKP